MLLTRWQLHTGSVESFTETGGCYRLKVVLINEADMYSCSPSIQKAGSAAAAASKSKSIAPPVPTAAQMADAHLQLAHAIGVNEMLSSASQMAPVRAVAPL